MTSAKVEFVSYDGRYPNLCRGVLVLSVGGTRFVFDSYSLRSGGSVWFDSEWSDHVDSGEWSVDVWPTDFPEDAKDEAVDIINANVPAGCCGGCI